MLGREHALSGLAAGAAVGELVSHLPAGSMVVFAGFTAAFATLPDLDQRGSCAARSLGFASEACAFAVNRLSGGHRHATHSVLGVGVFTAAAWFACTHRHDLPARVALGVFLMLAFAAGLRALHVHSHLADVVAAAGAVAVAVDGWHLALVAVACALGCATHIVGDLLTDRGCELAWPLSAEHFRLLPKPLAFETGTEPETLVIAPCLGFAILVLAWHAATIPGYVHMP